MRLIQESMNLSKIEKKKFPKLFLVKNSTYSEN